MHIRPELKDDQLIIRKINEAAFPKPAEADLVDLLRERDNLTISLLAVLEDGQSPIGHIAFSPVIIEKNGSVITRGLGLGPIAIMPEHQKQGIGSALVLEGLRVCKEQNVDFVVLLGDPAYYSRFGFEPASAYHITNEYGVDEPCQIIALREHALTGITGLIKYSKEFSEIDFD